MSGVHRKQKRVEARREYERFTKLWREEMRLANMYGKKTSYKRPTFSQWYAQHEFEFGNPPPPKPIEQQPFLRYEGDDPWIEQLDERVTKEPEPEGERGVATIQIVGEEEV